MGVGVLAARARAADGTRGRGYLPELQGLRGVAIVLVMVYHVWFLRVSGGVDVFYVISGLLITGSIVRALQRDGRVGLPGYVARLVVRLFPVALLVLLAVLVLTPLVLPSARWSATLQEILAAALYYENWQLAADSVDYLASRNAASPVQHYWSLGVQGNFYLLWPLLLTAAVWLGARRGLGVRRCAFAVLAVVFAVSLLWSVVHTAQEQQAAYFDTFARLWEFALGGMVGLALPRLRLPAGVRVPLGWLGLAGLVLCGVLVQGAAAFPGYAALLPTLAAAAVLIASDTHSASDTPSASDTLADTHSAVGVDRFLRARPVRYLGDLSYALYLWHWPLLIGYLAYTGQRSADLAGGVGILLAALALSAATKWLVEDRVRAPARGRRGALRAYAVGAAWLVPVLVCALAFTGYVGDRQRSLAAPIDTHRNPGPAVLVDDTVRAEPGAPVRPDPMVAAKDKPVVLKDGCAQGLASAEVITCEYGELDAPTRTVAVVGGSHTEHWVPALLPVARHRSWKLVTMIKRGCLLSTDPQTINGRPYGSCATWNDNVLAELGELHPDAVFSLSTTTQGERESVPAGFPVQWSRLERLGIDVYALRDTPRLGRDMPECVERNGVAAAQCELPRADVLAGHSPADDLATRPRNVVFLDLNRYFCPAARCPAVIGNVLIYRDTDHITATYAELLGPMLDAEFTARLHA